MPVIPSKKELDESRTEFALLPQDDYKLAIVDIKEEKEKKFESQEEEDVVNITFDIISLKDGSPAGDVDGKSAHGRKIWFKARPNSIGFMTDGTPAKTRCLIAYLTDADDIFAQLKYDGWKNFLGEEVNAEIIQYINTKGVKRNKIGRFLPKRKYNMPHIKPEEIPVIEDDPKMVTRAKIKDMREAGGVKFPEDDAAEGINVADIPF